MCVVCVCVCERETVCVWCVLCGGVWCVLCVRERERETVCAVRVCGVV